MHGMDVRCSQFLDVANESRTESARDFRISASKRETNESSTELSLPTQRSRGSTPTRTSIGPGAIRTRDYGGAMGSLAGSHEARSRPNR